MKAVVLPMAVLAVLALPGCEREQRRFTTPAGNSTPDANAARLSTNQPALARADGVTEAQENRSPYIRNAYAVSQGKRLYRWYNCNGCHASGGGSMGPA